MSLLELQDISYKYSGTKKMVLNHINYTFDGGKIYAIVGKSGAGKTTLLSVLSSLATPTSGKILINGEDVANIDKYKLRSSLIGVVFQNFNLLSHLTAIENVILSMDISGKKYPDKRQRAIELLDKVCIDEDDMDRRVLKLSGGQQQRVAIARALSYDPEIILADEPTGNLDLETQDEIMEIFRRLADEGKCVIVVTHSPDVAACADVTYALSGITRKADAGKKKSAS